MNDRKEKRGNKEDQEISRREFLRITGVVVAGAGAGVGLSGCTNSSYDHGLVSIAVSQGYLIVDTRKCQGCFTCMLMCSLVHEGVASLSLSRIQIIQNPFDKWPDDVSIFQCRQCELPTCVEACPRRALHVDVEHGNVRRVDKSRCIGCGKCVRACNYTPKRPIIAGDREYDGDVKSRKCDLCVDTPYFHDQDGEHVTGGPSGMQACVQACPVGAIRFTPDMPEQAGDDGYYVNLRDGAWAALGYPVEDEQEG